MELINYIGAILGVIATVVSVGAVFLRSQNKVVSNDLVHSMKLEEMKTAQDAIERRLMLVESTQIDLKVNMAEIRKDLHFIAEHIKAKGGQ